MTPNPDRRLSRAEAAEALTQAGYPISRMTLQHLASRGTGPAYTIFGKRAGYLWQDLVQWAQARCVPRGGADDEPSAA